MDPPVIGMCLETATLVVGMGTRTHFIFFYGSSQNSKNLTHSVPNASYIVCINLPEMRHNLYSDMQWMDRLLL